MVWVSAGSNIPESPAGEASKKPRNLKTKDRAGPQDGGGGFEGSKTLASAFCAVGANNEGCTDFGNRRTTGLGVRGPVSSNSKV